MVNLFEGIAHQPSNLRLFNHNKIIRYFSGSVCKTFVKLANHYGHTARPQSELVSFQKKMHSEFGNQTGSWQGFDHQADALLTDLPMYYIVD